MAGCQRTGFGGRTAVVPGAPPPFAQTFNASDQSAAPREFAGGGFREQEQEFHSVLEDPEFHFERVGHDTPVGGGFKTP